MRGKRAYQEPKPFSFFISCSGSSLCLSGVGVVGEDVGIDIVGDAVRIVEDVVESGRLRWWPVPGGY